MFGSAIAALATALPLAADAQNADGAKATARNAGPQEVVVVTAQRREQSAQEVGIALSVLTGRDLQARGVTSVNQLQYSTPSLEVVPAFGSGQPEFRLRGVGFDDYASNNTSTVGVYVNEVAYPIPAQTQGLLFDVSRVEVLRGPQGTLYGRNTTGGAINFITNPTTDTLTAGITEDYGSHNKSKTEAYVSGPLGRGLRARLAGITDQGGAWQTNRTTGEKFGDKNQSALRGTLDWDVTNAFSVSLDAHWGQDKSDGRGLYLFQDLAYNPALAVTRADRDVSRTGWGGSQVFSKFTGIATNAKPFRDNQSDGVDLHGKLDLGGVTLTSITAFEDLHRIEYNDWDASPAAYAGTYFNTRAHVFSQELRAASNGSGPVKWLIGGYYSKETLKDQFTSDFWQSLLFVTNTTYKQNVEAYALFGQTEYKVAARTNLILGLRGEHEKRSLGGFVTQGLFAPGAPAANFIAPTDVSASTNSWSGKLGVEHKASDAVLVYASISKGIKSGGFTAYNTPDTKLLHPIKPETLWAYEVGFKSDLSGDTLRLNGSAFYYDYKNQQVQSAIYTSFGPIGNIVNAPSSYIYGGEVELQWNPVRALRLTQSLGYKTGEFNEFTDLDIAASGAAGKAVFVSRAGKKVGFPPVSYGGSAAYAWDLGAYTLEAAADYAFHDKLTPLLLGPTYNVKAYWLANASLTLSPAKGPWTLTLWGRNVFDTKYDLTRNFFLPGISIAAPGESATWGGRVSLAY